MSSPSLDLDWRLRHAALDALSRITDRSGGVVTREQMTAGFEFEGKRVPFALRAKGDLEAGPAGPGRRGALHQHGHGPAGCHTPV